MQPVKNKTNQLLVLTGPRSETCVIEPDTTGEVPDVIWDNMKDRECVQALISARTIVVIHGKAATAPKVAPKAEEKDWSKLHWKKAQKLISAESDSDTLKELLEGEMRPKFKSMLQTRIGELEAA